MIDVTNQRHVVSSFCRTFIFCNKQKSMNESIFLKKSEFCLIESSRMIQEQLTSWHRRVCSVVGELHPNIYTFLETLCLDQTNTDFCKKQIHPESKPEA